jgi:hypothetical protein
MQKMIHSGKCCSTIGLDWRKDAAELQVVVAEVDNAVAATAEKDADVARVDTVAGVEVIAVQLMAHKLY